MVPMGNSVDDSKEFSIIDLIIAFCRSKRFRKIETGVIIAIIVLLKEDSSSSDEGCVSGNSELLLGIGVTENRGSAEGFFDFTEGVFL